MSEKIKLTRVRLSYEHIFKPTAFEEDKDPVYSGTFIIPKTRKDVIEAVRRTLWNVGAEEFKSDFAKVKYPAWPKGLTCALKDADTATDTMGEILAEKNPVYENCYILEANSTRRPVILDRNKAAVTEEDDLIYSGCYVNVSLNASAYTFGKVKKGVKCYLNGVQFVCDGERFGADAADDFDVLEDDEDDDMLD